MKIKEFIKDCASLDNPIGDLANDILRDKKFPSNESETEILHYLNIQTLKGGTNETYQEFLEEYKRV